MATQNCTYCIPLGSEYCKKSIDINFWKYWIFKFNCTVYFLLLVCSHLKNLTTLNRSAYWCICIVKFVANWLNKKAPTTIMYAAVWLWSRARSKRYWPLLRKGWIGPLTIGVMGAVDLPRGLGPPLESFVEPGSWKPFYAPLVGLIAWFFK